MAFPFDNENNAAASTVASDNFATTAVKDLLKDIT